MSSELTWERGFPQSGQNELLQSTSVLQCWALLTTSKASILSLVHSASSSLPEHPAKPRTAAATQRTAAVTVRARCPGRAGSMAFIVPFVHEKARREARTAISAGRARG